MSFYEVFISSEAHFLQMTVLFLGKIKALWEDILDLFHYNSPGTYEYRNDKYL